MRRCFLKHSETASKRLKIGAILCNRLQDVMGLWWCVCVCGCIYGAFLFSVVFSHSQAIKMKRWNNFVAKLALDKRVDFEEGDIGLPGGAQSQRMRMEFSLTKQSPDADALSIICLFYFEWCTMISPIQSLQSILSLLCPSPLAKQRVADCIKSSNVQTETSDLSRSPS